MKEAGIAIACFAEACERLSDYARLLRDQRRFAHVRTGADIRNYESGWRLEKWVEAELNNATGEWAAWWIELGAVESGLIVTSSLSISHNACFICLPSRIATSTEELERALRESIDVLTGALEQNPEFARAVDGCLRI